MNDKTSRTPPTRDDKGDAADKVDGPLESLGKAVVEPVLGPERMSEQVPERGGVAEDRVREQLDRQQDKAGRG